MPKYELKQLQKELESKALWPAYWIYGPEQMKSREILRKIKRAVLGDQPSAFGEQVLEGQEVDAAEVVDAVQSLVFGGGPKLVIVRDAHLIKEQEPLESLLIPRSEVGNVCVFLSKDLDGRKKFSKILTEKAAVVPCEEVADEERDAWIAYLARARTLELPPSVAALLRSMDPWSLDIMDQELAKYAMSQENPEVLLGGSGIAGGSDQFLEAFFRRDYRKSMEAVESFADRPDESLPLLGLLAWNVRHLALVIADREKGTRYAKLNPYLADRFRNWSKKWKLKEISSLQKSLAEVDFGIKQTPKLPVGLWSGLVSRFCSHN